MLLSKTRSSGRATNGTRQMPPSLALYLGHFANALGLLILALLCPSKALAANSLFTAGMGFSANSHIVSSSFFIWFDGSPQIGPWQPLEGSSTWNGDVNFFKSQIKQIMAANIDVLLVYQRCDWDPSAYTFVPGPFAPALKNFFRALYELRRDGYDVPKIAPVLGLGGSKVLDVSTTRGKDAFVSAYILFYTAYFGENPDPAAGDFLARIDNHVVLDVWHVSSAVENYTQLTRSDVSSRLSAALSGFSQVFNNSVYLIATADKTETLSFADEKISQFQHTLHSKLYTWNGITTVQLKAGYWDQNLRHPGQFLLRDGGHYYVAAWQSVNRSVVKRAYVESWNEVTEGSGVYAADPGPPFIMAGNTNRDTWSSINSSFEYIDTTAQYAAQFNDRLQRGASFLLTDLPTSIRAGETRTGTVIVRNEGDARWTGSAAYKLGQKSDSGVFFGSDRYLIDDAQDEISFYKGIYRGRPKTFTVSLTAPSTPGVYNLKWQMVQEGVQWFGDELTWQVTVRSADPGTVYVDAQNTGKQDGTLAFPYRTVAGGYNSSVAGDTVSIAAGSYPEHLRLTKWLRLESRNGTTRIGQ